ncbi:hypothetical protein Vretimale_4147 [Volvox reticuliferus]|uniref:Uncharacterized protein n=1 Tax=Volvox reticuliferus TaxID=1737510 RepID=A0A8J4FFA2_9CHLO|nr:hypothetical protein Vretifemale_2742 [Volvox reticuliferus]GIL98855.1 hypothetical protein Vretimale_4147 [Volvox reticuliferus]
MATRASLARGTAPKEVYEGRVHKWERRWLVHKKGTVKTEAMLELLRWIVTDVRCPELTSPRHPHIRPLKRPIIRQPSKKPSEQHAEQGGEPATATAAGAGAGAGAGTAAPGTAAQDPAAKATDQSVVQKADVTGEQTPAPAPGGELPPLQFQDLHHPQTQAGLPQNAANVTTAEDTALQGVGKASPSQEPNSATPIIGSGPRVAVVDPGPGAREAADTEACLPGDADGHPLASGAALAAEEHDVEMTDTAALP